MINQSPQLPVKAVAGTNLLNMKTIIFGKFGRGKSADQLVQYRLATTRTSSGSNKTRRQFCIELTGDRQVVRIYATSAEALGRLNTILASDDPHSRITTGFDVLGIHTCYMPSGWPNEGEGGIRAWHAPAYIVDNVPASLPDKPVLKYPFRTVPGIEVIRFHPSELVKFMPYHPEDSVKVRNRSVTVTFGKPKSDITSLHLVTADADLAARLAASIIRKTKRRLMVNEQVPGIALVQANGTRLTLGSITPKPKETK